MPRGPLPPELERFLAQPRRAVVATIGRDGFPVTAATWYEWDAGRLLLSMWTDGHRHRNILRDPRISLTVLADDWYSHVSLLGRAVELRDDPGFVDIDRISVHYTGEPYDERGDPCTSVVVEVERWRTYGDPLAEAQGEHDG